MRSQGTTGYWTNFQIVINFMLSGSGSTFHVQGLWEAADGGTYRHANCWQFTNASAQQVSRIGFGIIDWGGGGSPAVAGLNDVNIQVSGTYTFGLLA